MDNPVHVMIDIETMGNGSEAAILSIAAVRFDLVTGIQGPAFCRHVSLKSSVYAGLSMDASTVLWWLEQSDAARSRITEGQKASLNLDIALFELGDWINRTRKDAPLRLWAHGSSFDPVILANAYAACRFKVPWSFRDYRDTRTLFDAAGIDLRQVKRAPGAVEHDALDDAIHQANGVIEAYARLRFQMCASGE